MTASTSRALRVVAGIGIVWISAAQVDKSGGQDTAFQGKVQPFLKANCVVCHNAKVASAGLNLEKMTDLVEAKARPEIWARIFERLSRNEMPPAAMPPAAMPRPPQADVNAVANWIAGNFKVATSISKAAPTAVGNAGRVTLRRLNRVEYSNTIRDLLGLRLDAATSFPVDDSGYGFDNNGDVLSLSPLLMEKYISAATSLSKVAIHGAEKPKADAPLARFRAANQPSNGALPVSLSMTYVPYSMRGILAGTYEFPKDAEYEFVFKAGDTRGIGGSPPLPEDGGPTTPFTTFAYANKYGAAARNKAAAEAAKAGKPAPQIRRDLTPQQLETRKQQSLKIFPPANWAFELDGKVVLGGSHAGGYLYDTGYHPDEAHRQFVSAGTHSFRIYFLDAIEYDDPMDNYNPDFKGSGLSFRNLDIKGPFNAKQDGETLESRKRIFVCAEQTVACATQIVENLASRAYRRPATAQEVRQLVALVELNLGQGKPFDEGIRVAVQAILVSPSFLFRVETLPQPERAAIPGNAPGVLVKPDTASAPATVRAYPVTDYELASRLSYFLWSSMPDEALLATAKQQTLHQPAALKAQMLRMLADPKSSEFIRNFGGQWLGIRELMRRRPDPDLFKTIDDDLLISMQKETYLFIGALIKENRSILDIVDAPYTYANAPLAKFYGIPGVQGLDLQRVELKTDQRSGILTQGSVMIASAMPTRTSVVTRGKWVLENILGTPPPPPPPDVPALDEADLGKAATLRQKMEAHRANPACAACHKNLDPIGFSLENYDASGAWRTQDGDFPIDNSGTLPDGRTFQGAAGLKAILRESPDLIGKSLAEKLLTYALGRGLESFDAPAVNTIVNRLKADNYRMQTLVQAVIESKPFLMKDGEN